MKILRFENAVMNLDFLTSLDLVVDVKNPINNHIHLIFENVFEFKITFDSILKNKKIKKLSKYLKKDDYSEWMAHWYCKVRQLAKNGSSCDFDLIESIFNNLQYEKEYQKLC
jgi:hypothetical protein